MDATIIKGASHSDLRGTICFLNDFDMSEIKRFYHIENLNAEILRGWRGHRIEQRWFYATKGSFSIKLVKIDNWESPDKKLPVLEFRLSANAVEVLHVSAGFASLIQAHEIESKMIVFADHGIEHAKEDDYLFPIEYFQI